MLYIERDMSWGGICDDSIISSSAIMGEGGGGLAVIFFSSLRAKATPGHV